MDTFWGLKGDRSEKQRSSRNPKNSKPLKKKKKNGKPGAPKRGEEETGGKENLLGRRRRKSTRDK